MSWLAENPFAAPSDLPYRLPRFDLIRQEHYRPAFEQGVAEQRREVEAIANDPAPPTVANTLQPLEASGALLTRVSRVFFNLVESDATDQLRAVEAAVLPLLAGHRDAIMMDPRLFARVSALYEQRDTLGLDEEDSRLLRRYHLDMIRAGAALAEPGQARLREINLELSTLGTVFRNNLQADTNELAVRVESAAELAGLPADAIEAARATAQARGVEGYLLTLSLPSGQPALASLRDRGLRERLHRGSVARGRRGNEFDTRQTLTATVALRGERAALLGFAHHAAYVIADQTAGSVEAVMTLLTTLVEPTVANAEAEAQELTARLNADGFDGDLQPWDWAYYAAQVSQQRFATDAAALRPWFELGRVVRDGVFAAAEGLYGLTFVSRPDLPSYHPDVEVFEVFDEAGQGLGLFLADWYARATKRGGAWMDSFVEQSQLLGDQPVVVINLNLSRPPDGLPTLLTLDEVRTAFHEFGHVLHGLLSQVRYPRLSGTNVPEDFVEYPSQVNEMWAWRPELLARYAVHHETGERLSERVLDGVLASQSYGQGFGMAEILAAMLLDQAWHQRAASAGPVPPGEVEQFEQQALERAGLALPAVPPRYGSTYFAHVFAGGYSAGYYSYLWSEVLDADTVQWFDQQGGLNRHSGELFRGRLLSRGGAVDPMAAFEAVLGRPPRVEPLLERRGLTPVG